MATTNGTYASLLAGIRDLLAAKGERDEKLRRISALLEGTVPYYDWVGFYLVDPEDANMLVLGPYVGDPTEHTRIPIGSGICGQALAQKATFVVADVTKETNYLACSLKVRSEIVVPVMRDGRMFGELDIDSHTPDAFSDADREFLEAVADEVAGLF